MKKKVPTEVREHFLDDWAKIKTLKVLAEKLDEYEDVHRKTKRPTVSFINKEKSYRKTIPLDTQGSPSKLKDREVRNKEGMANRRYVNHFTENSHQAHHNQHWITPRCYTYGKEGHFVRACQDKSVNKQNSQKNKFSSPVKAQSNVVQAEEATKNIVTAKMDTFGSMCNFLAENIDRLKIIKENKKTKQRIKYAFFWPSLKRDEKTYCEACKPCQLRTTLTYKDRIPIQPIVRPNNPFEVWSVDCIGLLEPRSRRGPSYIVCNIDLCSRWAEAIPTKNITAKTTCEVLMKIFCQTGFPKTICTDQGTNFTAQLTQAFQYVLGVSPRFSTPGHPESMGAVERWNRTLKDMLNKNIQKHGNEWDVHLPYLPFAYKEIPHTLTGVSPYQLVYGRILSAPMSILKEFWTGERDIPTSGARSVEEYLKNNCKRSCKMHTKSHRETVLKIRNV
ncbi:hypothetical protein TNCV_631401 [Trichonephila clavipes]|nr:hypothetical protein TNCV_631401 [Trichonephila clavipes]